MCLYKRIIKRFTINSHWYWGNERYGLKTIIKVTDNKLEGEYYASYYVRGHIVYKQGETVQNPFNYRMDIESLHPLTKEEQQQWTPCSSEPS